MAVLNDLRQRVDDLPQYRYDSKTADGTVTKFQVSKYPIQPATGSITVGGSYFGSAGYTLNGTSGIVDFLGTAPANGTSIVAEYNCTQLNGTLLQDILDRHSGVLDLAAAEALEVRAAGAASYFSFISGDVKVDKTRVSENFMRLASQIRENYYKEDRQAVVDTQIEWEYADTERDED